MKMRRKLRLGGKKMDQETPQQPVSALSRLGLTILDWKSDPDVARLQDHFEKLSRLQAEAETIIEAAEISELKLGLDCDEVKVLHMMGEDRQADIDALTGQLSEVRAALAAATKARDEAAHDQGLVARALAPLARTAKELSAARLRTLHASLTTEFLAAMEGPSQYGPIVLYRAIRELHDAALTQFPGHGSAEYNRDFGSAAGLQYVSWPRNCDTLIEAFSLYKDEASGALARRWQAYFADHAAREVLAKAEQAAAAQEQQSSYAWFKRQRSGQDDHPSSEPDADETSEDASPWVHGLN